MTTGIVIMNTTPLHTFKQYCRKNRLEYSHARKDIAEDELGNDYILVSTYRSIPGRRFDRIIIISNELNDLTMHLSKYSWEAFSKQNSVLILSERCVK